MYVYAHLLDFGLGHDFFWTVDMNEHGIQHVQAVLNVTSLSFCYKNTYIWKVA